MEFFERAHVVKDLDASNRRKNAETVKKQFKQMLHGYKVSDNKLIKDSADDKNYEDSASVSGFSDLNLTNSSYDENVVLKTDSDSLDENISFTSNEINSDSSVASVTDKFENEDSFSENSNSVENELASFSNESDASNKSLPESSSESNTSEPFDPDGELAMKIIKKLKIKTKHSQKRKYSDNADDKINTLPTNIITKGKRNTTSKLKRKEIETESIEESDITPHSNTSTQSDELKSVPISPPYISITASDMPHQKIDDILGEYKHSTVRNIPADNQNTIHTTNNMEFSVEESMSVDFHTEDDVSSLVPELDDVTDIADIDELINLDTTTETTLINDSVNIIDDTIQSEQMNEEELIPPIHYDAALDSFKVYYGVKCCIITLKHPAELFIQGKVKVKPLAGTVELFGHILTDQVYNLFAPYYNFAQSIKTVASQNSCYGLFNKLTSSGLTVAEAEDIVTTMRGQDAVIWLERLHEKSMDFVDSNFKVTNLFTMNKDTEPFFKKASEILHCSLFSTRPWKSLVVHPYWKEAHIFAENKKSRGIVCGGKGSGKSTYLRYQVNKLLSNGPVLLIDLDPGQSEFTPAGNVSASVVTSPLFGPSFTHLRKPEVMLNIGIINTMDNAKRYVTAVYRLLFECKNNDAFIQMPWIVNTMGMTNALGLKFITIIIALLQPTYLLQYDSNNAKKRFETLLKSENVTDLLRKYKRDQLLSCISNNVQLDYEFILSNTNENPLKNSYSLTARDERYLNFLAYFSQLLQIHREQNLLAITPYEVQLKNLNLGSNVVVKEECITKVINGKIVALCQHARQCDSRVFTLSDKPLLCHGHGLIRGVDWEKEILYLITPVSGDSLRHVDTLVYADWVPELVGQENQLPLGTVVPYRTATMTQHKQLMSTPRRRFNPLQLLKMSRSS